ncbi:MAG TPA: hypothetical protein VEN81_07375 [Planctomycetota bacterium]|nr:hypothetical protein [Planctomycetota bacterium]
MGKTCQLCRRPIKLDDCFVRLERGDLPACRSCWEQLLLDPRRVLRSLQSLPFDRPTPPYPTPS